MTESSRSVRSEPAVRGRSGADHTGVLDQCPWIAAAQAERGFAGRHDRSREREGELRCRSGTNGPSGPPISTVDHACSRAPDGPVGGTHPIGQQRPSMVTGHARHAHRPASVGARTGQRVQPPATSADPSTPSSGRCSGRSQPGVDLHRVGSQQVPNSTNEMRRSCTGGFTLRLGANRRRVGSVLDHGSGRHGAAGPDARPGGGSVDRQPPHG
jgi:hypothetical protein